MRFPSSATDYSSELTEITQIMCLAVGHYTLTGLGIELKLPGRRNVAVPHQIVFCNNNDVYFYI